MYTQSTQIGYSIVPSAYKDKSVTWKSSDTDIATVDEEGVVTGKKVGTATITAALAEYPDVLASCIVTVTPLQVLSMAFDKESVSVVKTEDVHLYLTLNSAEVANKSMSWASSDENVATVAQNMNATYPLEAIVSAHKVGQAVITATAQDGSGKTATCTVTVTPLKVKSISLASSKSVVKAIPTQLKAVISPSEADNQEVKWSSLTPEMATVTEGGIVTGMKTGTATIKAEATDGSGVSNTFQITVTPRLVDKIYLPYSASVMRTTTQKLTVNVIPSEADNQSLVWSSGNESIATVDAQGNVTGVKLGTTTITAAATDGSGVSGTCQVTVTPLTASSITFAESKVNIQRGSTKKLSVTVLPEQAENKSVSWSSSDETVATVDESGLVTAINGGTTTITAKAQDGSGVEGTCLVHVLGLRFDYNKDNLRATLLPNEYVRDISIPQTTMKDMVTYTVDSIAPSCFGGVELDSLVLPSTVQKYGMDAFKGASIKNWTFNGTMGNWCAARFANAAANPTSVTGQLVLNNEKVKTVAIPTSIKELLPYTFYNCAGLDSVEVNMLVTSIGDGCFAKSTIGYFQTKTHEPPTLGTDALAANIGTLVVPQDYYGDYCNAAGWKTAKNILSSNDKTAESYFVADKALYRLDKATNEVEICNPEMAVCQTVSYKGQLTLPTTVEYNHKTYPLTAIEANCFKNCTELESITIPSAVKTMGNSAFTGCKMLSANYTGTLADWCAIDLKNGSANPMSIKGQLVIGGKELTEIVVPSSVKSLADFAFYGCTNLTRAEIGSQVESIGSSTFAGCTGITELKLLSFCKVDGSTFLSCPLVSVESGNESFWQSMGSDHANTLETAIIRDDYTGTSPMFTNYIKLKNVTLSDKITGITSFEGCTSLTELTVPEEVINISENAFKNCRNLKTLTMPSNYGMSIDANAFVNCTGLETFNYGGDIVDWCSIEFSNKYSNPMYYAQNVLFQGQQLTTLDVPEGSGAEYQHYAFVNLKSLKKVVISSITGGLSTFSGCSNLEEIRLTATQTSGTLVPAFKGEFDGVDKTTCKLYVPADLVGEYQQAYIWKDFLNILPLSDAPEKTKVQSITFTEQPHDMTVGEKQTLQVEVLPDNADNKSLSWSSSDTSVATVSSGGVVSALAQGTVTITVAATDGSGVSASCTLTVIAKSQPVTGIQLSQTTATMKPDEKLQLTATVTPDNADNKVLDWSSSDASVAFVSDDGLVLALATGVATITATTTDGSNLSAICIVTVVDDSGDEPTEVKVSSIEELTDGSIIRIYPYGKGGVAAMALSSNATSAELTSTEEAGEAGNTWTLLDAGNDYFYLVNSLGQYWAYQQSDNSFVPMYLASNKDEAVRVSLIWNTTYPGVAFLNAEDNTYLNNLYALDSRYNWYAGDGDPLTYDTNNTYEVYALRNYSTLLYFDATEVALDKGGSTILYLTCTSGNTSAVTVKSSDPSVATATRMADDGNPIAITVKGHKAGTAIVTAEMTDGSGAKATCIVNVTDPTAIEGVAVDMEEGTAYYTLSGVKLDHKPQQEGIYIRVKDGKSQKVVVK